MSSFIYLRGGEREKEDSYYGFHFPSICHGLGAGPGPKLEARSTIQVSHVNGRNSIT